MSGRTAARYRRSASPDGVARSLSEVGQELRREWVEEPGDRRIGLDAQRRAEISGRPAVHGLLHRPDRQRRERRKPAGDLVGRFQEFGVGNDPPGHTETKQIRGGVAVAEKQHLSCRVQANERGQERCHGPRDEEVERHLGEEPARALGPDGEIAVDRPFEATADGPPVDRPDNGNGPEHDGLGGALDRIDKVACFCFVRRVDVFLAIVSGAECPPGPGEHDRSRPGITVGIVECGGDVIDELPVHRVEAVGTMQRDGAYTVLVESGKHGAVVELVAHGLSVSVLEPTPMRPTRSDLGPTIDGLLAERAVTHPETVFLRFASGDLTFAEVDRRASRLAAGLASIGICRGDVVPVLLRNSPAFAITWLALCRLGAVGCLINSELRGPALRHVIGVAGGQVLIADAGAIGHLVEVADALGHVRVSVVVDATEASALPGVVHHDWAELARCTANPPMPTHGPLDPAMVLFTSGTTGASKGCVLPHRYTVRQASLMAEHLRFTPEDVFYCPFPMFHIDALVLTIGPALVLGTTAAIGERFSASGFWPEVRRFGATVFDFMGATLTMTWKRPPEAGDADNPVRLAWGVPVPEFAEQYERRFGLKLVELYGSTDAGLPMYHPVDEPRRERSCGRVIDSYDVRLLDPHGFEVPVGEVGEIAVRPLEPGIMSAGYLGMPEATLASRPDLWFRTSDLARRDEDGHHFFVGRVSDMIRRRGENISAFEVEEVVKLHPSVLDAAAYGVPSEFTEDDVMVAVVARPGAVIDPADVVRFCAQRAARHMVPRYVDVVDELPRTPTAKVRKEVLRERGLTPTTFDSTVVGRG